jgi:antitoxin ParD1/3/4
VVFDHNSRKVDRPQAKSSRISSQKPKNPPLWNQFNKQIMNMTQISINLPEPLTHYLQEQITAGHYPTASEYIQSLIQQDQLQNAHLEDLVIEGLDSNPASAMTSEDWVTIRAAVHQNLNPNA